MEYVRFPYVPKLGYITLSSFVESTIDDFVKMKKRQGNFEEYSEKRRNEAVEALEQVAKLEAQLAQENAIAFADGILIDRRRKRKYFYY
ncbi:hypothetical protein [Chengkuizengella axinellae]|uniref:Uncharacterized protein n=1 Tax=Chengkuizengella axinellae TaxID=3064388 RepID=A0ABT9J0A9_9BACL|nr:hypothetical protein [Chengkuizengella sp. 2205SS18-9]MDP5274455.1 hypothetical protein [Chengkuizengella sp. 2205SS18-9]